MALNLSDAWNVVLFPSERAYRTEQGGEEEMVKLSTAAIVYFFHRLLLTSTAELLL